MTNHSKRSGPRLPEVQSFIDRFQLTPHPEGGYFKEVFRSAREVKRYSSHSVVSEHVGPDREKIRSALTDIYFLLEKDDYSCFHRVESDEAWHHLSGGPLQLVLISPDFQRQVTHILEAAATGEAICVVPATWWQAAFPLSSFTLCSCSVGPGFDFSDFEMARNVAAEKEIKLHHPDFKHLI